jgi:thioredoxin 1
MENIEPEQFEKLLSSGEKTVAMFYADWCPFCKRFKPVFESAKSKYKKIEIKLNEDENPIRIVARKDAKMGVGLDKSDIDSMLKEIKWN